MLDTLLPYARNSANILGVSMIKSIKKQCIYLLLLFLSFTLQADSIEKQLLSSDANLLVEQNGLLCESTHCNLKSAPFKLHILITREKPLSLIVSTESAVYDKFNDYEYPREHIQAFSGGFSMAMPYNNINQQLFVYEDAFSHYFYGQSTDTTLHRCDEEPKPLDNGMFDCIRTVSYIFDVVDDQNNIIKITDFSDTLFLSILYDDTKKQKMYITFNE